MKKNRLNRNNALALCNFLLILPRISAYLLVLKRSSQLPSMAAAIIRLLALVLPVNT
jgi:hypothetical protein